MIGLGSRLAQICWCLAIFAECDWQTDGKIYGFRLRSDGQKDGIMIATGSTALAYGEREGHLFAKYVEKQ